MAKANRFIFENPVNHHMKNLNIIFLLMFFGFSVFSSNGVEGRANSSSPTKPIMLYFKAEWCAPCKIMQQAIFEDTNLSKEINKKYDLRPIDVDLDQNTSVKYMINAVPTIIILDGSGSESSRYEGGISSEKFKEVFLRLNNRKSEKNTINSTVNDRLPLDKNSHKSTPTYYLQFGAFSLRENAEILKRELSLRTNRSILIVQLRDSSLYRVQMGPFKNKKTADRESRDLKGQGLNNFVYLGK